MLKVQRLKKTFLVFIAFFSVCVVQKSWQQAASCQSKVETDQRGEVKRLRVCGVLGYFRPTSPYRRGRPVNTAHSPLLLPPSRIDPSSFLLSRLLFPPLCHPSGGVHLQTLQREREREREMSRLEKMIKRGRKTEMQTCWGEEEYCIRHHA